jgi:hypothetical protein
MAHHIPGVHVSVIEMIIVMIVRVVQNKNCKKGQKNIVRPSVMLFIPWPPVPQVAFSHCM